MAQIGTAGRRTMAALEAGTALRRADTGGAATWRGSGIAASAATVAELVRHDLVAIDGDRLALTAAGRGWTLRQTRPEAANRMLAERAVDHSGRPSRTRRPAPGARTATVNLAESPLGWLAARGLVDARQYEAGERLRSDWTIAGHGPSVTMRWEVRADGPRRGSGAPADPTLAQIAARRRVAEVGSALGPGLSDVLWRVVCAGDGLADAEGALGWPKRSAKLVLGFALDRLADAYGLP